MKKGRFIQQKGFSSIEILLGILVLVVIGGAVFTVMHKNSTTKEASDSTSTPAVAAPKATVDASKVGTSTGIDQLTTLDQKSEDSVDAKYEASEKTETNSACKIIGITKPRRTICTTSVMG